MVVEMAGLRFRVAGRDDLIRMKQVAGRAQDIDDIAALTDPAASQNPSRIPCTRRNSSTSSSIAGWETSSSSGSMRMRSISPSSKS